MGARPCKGNLGSHPEDVLARIPRTSLTCENVKERQHLKRESAEKVILGLHTRTGPGPRRLFLQSGLSLNSIRMAFRALCVCGRLRATLRSLRTGARFKHFGKEEQSFLRTKRPRCGGLDSVRHMLECYAMGPMPSEADETADSAVHVATRADTRNPQLPLPVW